MSIQFQTAIQNILNMPYFKNEHARSAKTKMGHEDAVAQQIADSGFSQFFLHQKIKNIKRLIKSWVETGKTTDMSLALADMPSGSYILQPAGTQAFPDILVRDFSGAFIAVECKSVSNGTCPMWNDNVPQQNAVYILSTGKFSEKSTTVFLGSDVITTEMINLLKEQERAMIKLAESFAARMRVADTYNRGWIQKSRRQNFQQGGNSFTNWFAHADRNKCEQNVLTFALQQ